MDDEDEDFARWYEETYGEPYNEPASRIEQGRGGFARATYTSPEGIDPYTGLPYDEQSRSAGGLTGRALARAKRKAEKAQRKERERERDLHWFRGMEERGQENVDLADALASGAPSYEDLLGGTEEFYMDESALADAVADPASIEAQMRALGELENVGGKFGGIYDAGGYTDVERGQIQSALMQAGRDDAARQAAIRNEMAMSGMGNSGMQYAQQMLSQQSAANRGSEAATDIATQAQMRALQALEAQGRTAGQAGSLGSQVRGQSFDEAATRASATDDMTRTNLGRRDQYQDRRSAAHQQGFENQATATGAQMGARSNEQARLMQERLLQRGKKGAKFAEAMESTSAGVDALTSIFG